MTKWVNCVNAVGIKAGGDAVWNEEGSCPCRCLFKTQQTSIIRFQNNSEEHDPPFEYLNTFMDQSETDKCNQRVFHCDRR